MINRYNILQHCKTVNHLQGFVLQVINSFAMLQDIILLIMKKTCDFGSLLLDLSTFKIHFTIDSDTFLHLTSHTQNDDVIQKR